MNCADIKVDKNIGIFAAQFIVNRKKLDYFITTYNNIQFISIWQP